MKDVVQQLVGTLRFDRPSLPPWKDAQWFSALSLCDQTQLSLPIAENWHDQLPPLVAERLKRDLANTGARQRTVREKYGAIAAEFDRRGLTFAVLKGFAGDGQFFPCAYQRAQYDLDFLLPADSVFLARDALVDLGYHPLGATKNLPTDHLPVMVPKTGWQWKGNFYDPEIPVSVDLHYRLWDEDTERFPAPGWEQFFERRLTQTWDGLAFPGLLSQDALGYHSLHLLRHLLRGSLRVSHVYELAYFLNVERSSAFWRDWEAIHAPELRILEGACFALAQRWFGCYLSDEAETAISRLPAPVSDWFDCYGDSPLSGIEHPNKDELWLHLSLITGTGGRLAVLRRRLLPAQIPQYADTAYVPDAEITTLRRWLSRAHRAKHVLRRSWHHVRTLPGALRSGSVWAWRNSGFSFRRSATGQLSAEYWRFLAGATLFNLGSFVFVVLYNLYLSDLGFREDELGQFASAMTVGSIVGCVPAGVLLRRFGVRISLTLCFIALSIFSLGRILFPTSGMLIAFSVLSGAAFSLFAVTVAPAIAALSNERTRPRAFSIFFAVGIALGIAGGQLAGRLPALLGSKRLALLAACVVILLAALPALTLKARVSTPAGKHSYPPLRVIGPFLVVIGVWSMAAGAFSPFFNVYFAQRSASVEQIGNIYSTAQVAQVVAILGAPHLVARLGLIRGVVASQALCGLALFALAAGSSFGIGVAAASYAAYLGFHFMGEPGLFSLLMNRAAEEQQSGASALNFLATFAGQAIAVALAGWVASRYGYSPLLMGAAGLSLIAAGLSSFLSPGKASQ